MAGGGATWYLTRLARGPDGQFDYLDIRMKRGLNQS